MEQTNAVKGMTGVPANGTGIAAAQGGAFREILAQTLQSPSLRFSTHAARRLESRNISFSEDQMRRIGQAVDTAAAKGSRGSVLMMKDAALVIDVNNRTVITCVDTKAKEETVFTNVDSVIALTNL